jgi:hypothetical protein
LNYALSQISANGSVTILQGGPFGPIRLTAAVSIVGNDPNVQTQIIADGSATVGCVGASPGSCGPNNGYAVEVAAGASDTIKISHLLMSAGPSGVGALKFTSGGKISLTHDVFRGNGSATGPIIALYPDNGATSQAQVYFSNSDVGFNNGSSPGGGAVEVKPSGSTSLKLHFNHVEVHNASYGIRTDGSLLSSTSSVVATFISESEFFSFNNAAVNAFSTAGTGIVNAAFVNVNVLNAAVALKANGPQSFVIISNCTVAGNAIGTQVLGGATISTSNNNTIRGNGTDISGSLTNGGTQ